MLNLLLVLTLFSAAQIPESTLVSKIRLQGNSTIKSKSLKKILYLKEKEIFDELYLERDSTNIIAFYKQNGFNNTSVGNEIKPTSKGKIVYFKISEGPRSKISSIKISGATSFSEAKILSLLPIKKGDYLITRKTDDAEKEIDRWYKNSGYPYISTEQTITINGTRAAVNFQISEGALAYIKELKVRGNQKVSSFVILRTTEIKPGEKFSLDRLERARQRLYATRLYERVSFYVLDGENKDSLSIRFDVLELPVHSVSFGLGVQTPPTRLLLSSEWEHLNFLSRGHDLLFSASYAPTFGPAWRGEFKGTYRIFYILNLPFNFSFQPSYQYENKDSTKQGELSIETGVSRYFGLKLEAATYLRYLRFWLNPPLDSSNTQSITNSQTFYLRYDTRNNIFTPERGIYFLANFQLAGGIYAGENDFYKTQVELTFFKKLLNQFVFGFRVMNGIAIPYARTEKIPYYEEFSISGNNDLRGYGEKTLGPDSVGSERYGEAISNINVELRTHFQKLIDFVVFSDFGKVTDRHNLTNFSLAPYQYSVGAGIRINTPFGPVRVDYAKRLKDAPEGDWGKICLGILNIF